MELKRIIARDSRSANEKAIQLYGPEVLIISSQRVDQQTELIVAVDVPSEPLAFAVPEKFNASAQEVQSSSKGSEFKPDAPKFSAFSEVFETVQQSPQPLASLEVPEQEPLTKAPVAMNPGQTNANVEHYEQQRNLEIVNMLRQEMSALRQEFALSRQMQPWRQTLGLSADIDSLTLAMQEVGIPVGLRTLLTDSIRDLESLDAAWPVIERLLAEAIQRPTLPVPDSGVHALCGPSGAGKTSMLGRLAFAAAQVHGAEKQVMISFGAQRPGAWAQIQLLASQAGAACFRAADVAMLQTLLDDLHGKTVWIDTPGTDFTAQAKQLIQVHSGLHVHAVLPVDATVTNVQKILQNPEIRWSSLMLTKLDEAAYPWPLIKGLCDQSLAVSCMANDSQMTVTPLSFDAQRLVSLALAPLLSLLPEVKPLAVAEPIKKPLRKPRVKKSEPMPVEILMPTRSVKSRRVTDRSSAKAVHG